MLVILNSCNIIIRTSLQLLVLLPLWVLVVSLVVCSVLHRLKLPLRLSYKLLEKLMKLTIDLHKSKTSGISSNGIEKTSIIPLLLNVLDMRKQVLTPISLSVIFKVVMLIP